MSHYGRARHREIPWDILAALSPDELAERLGPVAVAPPVADAAASDEDESEVEDTAAAEDDDGDEEEGGEPSAIADEDLKLDGDPGPRNAHLVLDALREGSVQRFPDERLLDPELDAIATCLRTLEALSLGARRRAVDYLSARFDEPHPTLTPRGGGVDVSPLLGIDQHGHLLSRAHP